MTAWSSWGCTVRGLRIAYCAGFSLRNGYVPVTVSPRPERGDAHLAAMADG